MLVKRGEQTLESSSLKRSLGHVFLLEYFQGKTVVVEASGVKVRGKLCLDAYGGGTLTILTENGLAIIR